MGNSNPAIIRNVVVFPQPEGPKKGDQIPFLDIEIDLVDRDHFADTASAGEYFGDVFQLQIHISMLLMKDRSRPVPQEFFW